MLLSELTALESRAFVTFLVCATLLGISIVIAMWHYNLKEMPVINERKKRQAEMDAAQEERDKSAAAALEAQRSKQSHDQWMRAKEVEQAEDQARTALEVEELRHKQVRAYDDAMKDIATKYALYCPGCGKVMTLQHANRLPADAQSQLGYVPPAAEDDSEEPKTTKRRAR